MFEQQASIALLTHAPTDLLVLQSALLQMPEGFPQLTSQVLQELESAEQMVDLLEHQLASARIIVLRVLGRPGSVPGFAELVRYSKSHGRHLIAISGTGEPDAELAAASTVAPDVLHQVSSYFQAGGSSNMTQLLRYLSDHFLLTGYGFEPASDLPEHGIYHPDLAQDATIEDWLTLRKPEQANIGIVFYRAHWLSGNTRFIDALIEQLEKLNLNVLPIFTSSLRMGNEHGLPTALRYFYAEHTAHIDVLINTTSFAMGEITAGETTPAGWSVSVLEQLNVPVLQAITSGMMLTQWEQSPRGLNPLDAAMNVVLPEFDGRIITVPLSFKAKASGLAKEAIEYEPLNDRVVRIAQIASRFARLKRLSNADKRIAFVFTNSNSKASQIGNAVGLDAPASLMHILQALQADGYAVDTLPESGTALIHELIDRCGYDNTYLTSEQLAQAVGLVSSAQYESWFADLPLELQQKMIAQWGAAPGEAYVHDGQLSLAGLEFGNTFVALQPPRGYGMDPDAIYHQPDLPPTHHYYALYRWLRDDWKADAIVHVGKHGTLEWLPGKGVGLSEQCFPDALLSDMPLFYPFIINDPGEGAQAKRRGHAVVIDHLTPPMTTADTYGALAQLTQLVDEYYQVEVLDPAKLPLLQQQIWDLVKQTNLDADLQARLIHHDHDHDHEHEHEHEHNHEHHEHHHCHHGHDHDHHEHEHNHEEELPEALTKMAGSDVAHLIEDLDGYLCELGAAQIRDGLHILGQAPKNEQLTDMLVSLTRLPNQTIPGLPIEVARLFNLEMNDLLDHPGRRLVVANVELESLAGRALATHADALETIEVLCKRLFTELQIHDYAESAIESVICEIVGLRLAPNPTYETANYSTIKQILSFACRDLVPNLARATDEIDHLLLGLAGGYVPAGPSGSPTRGMAHILPTGRNFYSVDPRSVPSQSAWRVGQQLAHEVLSRYVRETDAYPESVAISIWGTSAMRTHGDDVAQILALLGVRPVWQVENRQVSGVEIIPLEELKRPRIDVTTRISGFFRDAFPQLIDLIDDAVNAVIILDEPLTQNFVRKHYLAELGNWIGKGLTEKEAQSRAAFRIFGAKPGSYGAGILPLIQEKNWQTDADFAEAYVNWGGYAYGRGETGKDERDAFRTSSQGKNGAPQNRERSGR